MDQLVNFLVKKEEREQNRHEELLERLSKISGALRYIDKGLPLQISGNFNTSGRYDVDLGIDIKLFEKADYTICLESFSTTSNIQNITAANNRFYFSSPTSGLQFITLPAGTYSIDALNSTIQYMMQNSGYYNPSGGMIGTGFGSGALYNVHISLSSATNKSVLQIRLGSGYTVYFNQPNTFHSLLGFLPTDTFTDPNPSAELGVNGVFYAAFFSTNAYNVINDVLAINIGCTLAEGFTVITNNGQSNQAAKVFSTQILASKSYVDPPGTILAINSSNPLKVRLCNSSKTIRTFSVFSVDNNLKPLDFGGSLFFMNLVIEQSRK